MARKTKDLFQLLEKRRSKGSFKIKPDPDPGEPVDVLGAVGGWFGGLLGRNPHKRRRTARKGPARANGFLISGPALCGMAFSSLVVGFLLGQAFGSSGPNELRAARVPPEWLSGESSPGELAPDAQIAVLGEFAYPLGQYPVGADEQASREQAERLASYLRTQGLGRTRIFKLYHGEGLRTWLTLYYTEGNAVEQAVIDRLNRIAPPPFEPGWAQVLARLAEHPQPARLTPSPK